MIKPEEMHNSFVVNDRSCGDCGASWSRPTPRVLAATNVFTGLLTGCIFCYVLFNQCIGESVTEGMPSFMVWLLGAGGLGVAYEFLNAGISSWAAPCDIGEVLCEPGGKTMK